MEEALHVQFLFWDGSLRNQRNVVSDVSKDLTACEELMEMINCGTCIGSCNAIGWCHRLSWVIITYLVFW
jgi:succinate dehydrogenase/fumarate reductase-like Fe-S protein